MRLLALPLALALSALPGCAPSPPTVRTDPGLVPNESPALALERALELVARDHVGERSLWPGFDPLAVPLAVYDGERTYLFRHPDPPEGFLPARGAVPVTHVLGGRHEAVTANSSAEIGGVMTATVLLDRGGPSPTPAGLAALAVHEAFHVFQRARHPGWSGNEADLFVYPVADADLLALRRLETEALQRALAEREPDRATCWARAALALRGERFAQMDSAFAAYERGTELNEGVAAFVEARAGGHPTVDFPAEEFTPAAVRQRAYVTGPALAFLLDRFAPGWPEAFEAGDHWALDEALAAALGEGEACEFKAGERAAAEVRARADVGALGAERDARLAVFEARPGWRVIVEAAGEPLWPQGFDPLNVERVGPARVLHERFLQLGNGAGRLEVLGAAGTDVEALTEGAGPHPLFNGVRSVAVVGLEEPEVTEAEGAVAVRVPGFEAAFTGARVALEGQTVRIRIER